MTVGNALDSWEVYPSAAKPYLTISADGQHISFQPPPNFNTPVRITYYVTNIRQTGLLDPEDKRTKGVSRPYTDSAGTVSQRVPCTKNDLGFITCWGQLNLRPASISSNVQYDPMEQGAAVRATASRNNAAFRQLYNSYINETYPGGEQVSGVSAYYILRTIACYFVPGTNSQDNKAYGCDTSGTFQATTNSTLCNDPQLNGYQRCIDGFCDWYAYVPANITCDTSTTLQGTWDSDTGTASGTKNFFSLVGTVVNIDDVLASQTCVKLPCPKRAANCTP
jgi:hypothetical protein